VVGVGHKAVTGVVQVVTKPQPGVLVPVHNPDLKPGLPQDVPTIHGGNVVQDQ
jgi:hypothetical protein